MICWSGGPGVGDFAGVGVCVRARCFLGWVGVTLCVSCVCSRGIGLCRGVRVLLFVAGVGGIGFGWLRV